jgi:hypothetical protein
MNFVRTPSFNHRLPALTIFIVSTLSLSIVGMDNAHACTACGDSLSTDWAIQGVSTTPGFIADLSHSYINQNQQRYGTSKASPALISSLRGAGQEIEDYTKTQMVTASLNYTNDTWGVNTQLPFIRRTHGTFGEEENNYGSSFSSNLGDVRVIGRYTGLSVDRTAGIIAGLKLPTGSTNTKFSGGTPDLINTSLDRALQNGTGSTDLIMGGFVSGAAGKYGWFAQGTLQHAVSTKTIDGLDYRPGDTYLLNTGMRYAKFGSQFTPMLQLMYTHRRPDTGAGASPADSLTQGPSTGGTLVHLAPGATIRIGGGTSVYGFIQLPVYQNANSLQLGANYTLTLGIRHSF